MKQNKVEDKCRELSRICADECVSTSLHASRMDDRDECISACNSCAQLCMMVVKATMLTDELLRKCEDACLACATACSNYQDIQFQACAASCRKCADECSRVVIYGTF